MRLIDADALDSVVLRMNAEGAQITRLDYKIIDCVIFEFPTIDAVPVIRCKDCRYYDARAKTMDTLCTRKQGCRETIPEGFCGWAIPKMGEVEHEAD